MQHATTLSFLLVVYARYLKLSSRVVHCGNVVASPARLVKLAKGQVTYTFITCLLIGNEYCKIT